MHISRVLFLYISFFYLGMVYCFEGENDLRVKILSRYDRLVRPVKYYENITVLTYGASIYQIVDFDAKAETLSTLIWQRVCWKDANIVWNPLHHDGIKAVRFSQSEVWVPDLVPYNDIGSFDAQKFSDLIPIKGYPNGRVCWAFPTILKTICTMDVTNFPSDEQKCKIMLGSWQYSDLEVTISCHVDHLDDSNFSHHSQWMLLG